ncbi:hypothetical protein BDV26DRAFT_210266 [Aspergillus bertholletiae]|uniref:Uncharacterized protein n=1 Tax=Aspergillus bertholletiae TaxID=1226010 RepID=A0A5N7BM13_9EURO|nr:hypothetical protein BDV26DRAFT_210266 [Aspergillus bertholletiae]
MMNSLRLHSASVRRAVASPLAAPPSSSAYRSIFRSSSSYISSSSSSSFSTTATPRAQRPFASCQLPRITSPRNTGISPLQWKQARTMATEVPKIKVKNPVVELDGDEVSLII